jgi:hypothetical protein
MVYWTDRWSLARKVIDDLVGVARPSGRGLTRTMCEDQRIPSVAARARPRQVSVIFCSYPTWTTDLVMLVTDRNLDVANSLPAGEFGGETAWTGTRQSCRGPLSRARPPHHHGRARVRPEEIFEQGRHRFSIGQVKGTTHFPGQLAKQMDRSVSPGAEHVGSTRAQALPAVS